MAIEMNGWRSFFLSSKAAEVYARIECFSRWGIEREPGSVEGMAGRWRMTVARTPSPAANNAQMHDSLKERAWDEARAEWEASRGPVWRDNLDEKMRQSG